MLRSVLGAGFAIAILLAFASNARAVTASNVPPNAKNVPYVMGFHVLNSGAHPYLGQLRLTFNNGVLSGTYTDLSVKPGGPFANAHNITVSGNYSSSHVTLIIRQVTFRGTFSGPSKMSGSATIRGAIYTFEAHQGSPGSGK
jgi:hypothetical protein